ncbi:MAG: S9 family peptidase [Chloroflexota bacterium]
MTTAPTGYRRPPAVIADLVMAPETPQALLSPNQRFLALLQPSGLPTIAELARPELGLAGLRIDPAVTGPSRSNHYEAIMLKRLADNSDQAVQGLPDAAAIDQVEWSPDGRRLAFTLRQEDGISLWQANAEGGTARRIVGPRLNATYGRPYAWLPDSRGLVCKLVPPERPAPPTAPTAPGGPAIQENAGRVAPARTYQDLLKDAHDEALFIYHLTAQLALVTLDCTVRPFGAAGLIHSVDPSPDGRYLLVETLHRPFSYSVPVERFPRQLEVWDLNGQVVYLIADLPLADAVPIAFMAVAPGPRQITWRPDVPATLVWSEAQDGGDPSRDAAVRDRLFTLAAPFAGDPRPICDLALRFQHCRWSASGIALVTERWWRSRQERVWLLRPNSAEPLRLLYERSWEDRYGDPGQALEWHTAAGKTVIWTSADGRSLLLAGTGASPEGDRPFVDRFDLDFGRTERLWRSAAPRYEVALELLDQDGATVLTRREGPDDPPNYVARHLETGEARQLTTFSNPVAALAGVQKEFIRYPRADGVELTATLYLPAGYRPEQGPLPLLMWAYPREFKSAAAAAQVSDSPFRFVRPTAASPLFWLPLGFAVLASPAMPIIGEDQREPNDTYVEQLAASAQAAVDAVVGRGVADRRRIAIGGHSYGAFMAANLLVHTDLFCAGIARSGAYNRTLTPFGFQQEERTLWQAPQVYDAMSPFMHVVNVTAPLLLIHGVADDNTGTFPLQSERFFAALQGLGKTARLVLLPHESHGYRARESVLHMLWEMTEWLERYVRTRDSVE